MVITGSVARVKVGFQLAAILANWNLTYKQEEIGIPYAIVSGSIAQVDLYWITQKPFKLGLLMNKSTWWVWGKIILISEVEKGTPILFRVDGDPEAFTQF